MPPPPPHFGTMGFPNIVESRPPPIPDNLEATQPAPVKRPRTGASKMRPSKTSFIARYWYMFRFVYTTLTSLYEETFVHLTGPFQTQREVPMNLALIMTVFRQRQSG